MMGEYETNEERKEEENAFLVENFNNCDEDNNGLLNCKEYCNWCLASDARNVEKFGEWPSMEYKELCDFWLALNTIDTSYMGVSLVDLGKVMNIWKICGEVL